jgi:hypothetical protein
MMDIVERLAQQAAETINGGEFYDGKWYTEGQRQAWRKAMTPAADEIERLRGENQKLLKALTGLYEACKWEKISPEIDAARKALGEQE